MAAKYFIGTSGYHYKHWLGTFYPEGTAASKQLDHYIQFFRTVELNNPFYRLPKREVFENWRDATPKDFVFAVKANRFITHMKKLNNCEEPIKRMLDAVSGLGKKLGPIVFQLPPRWNLNIERFESFVQLLPKGYRFVFEFRNETWYNEEVYRALRKHKLAFCIYQLAGHESPRLVTANFVYVRLHGPSNNKYEGSYSEEALQGWADQCKEWLAQQKDVYIYFDNDQAGYAAFNAVRLNELMGSA